MAADCVTLIWESLWEEGKDETKENKWRFLFKI
jgi:hypothetical protein